MADTARLQQQPQSQAVSDTKPPGAEVGTASQNTGGLGGWAAFLDEAEYVPQLTFPGSIPTYHRMRSDSQIEALHLGTVQPIREYRWWIDPNKAPKKLVESAATDLGLPVKGEDPEESGIKRAAAKFDFDAFLSDALLGPLYGFMHFEIVGEIQEALDWRMKKLAPRHPRTIQQFKVDDHGELLAIKQNFGPNFAATPPEILAQKLLTLTWRPEAGTVVGRSMLRSMYREWLVKDRVLRIATINLERAGGVPVLEASQGASDKQIEDLAQMARQFKVAEGGGGAVPFGTKVTLVGGSVPDAISLMTYCDECMARVWALMLIQLGQTQTGSRALGGEFAIYAARAQRLMGKWICSAVNNFLDRYVEWNEPLADYAPRLAFEPSKPEGMSVTDLVSLLDAGALTTDPELEEWLRAEHNLPDKPEPPTHPDLGEMTPEEVALVQQSRNPPDPNNPDAPQGKPGEPTYKLTPAPKRVLDPTSTQPTLASGSLTLPRLHRGIRASLTLPDRQLRRAPSANEIRAAVDFRALDEAHAGTVARLHAHYLNETLPSQIKSLGDQLRAGVKPHELTTPVAGIEAIARHLGPAAESGVSTAIREAQAQGLRVDAGVYAGVAQAARDRTLAQAEHVATLNANGLSLGAQRRAGRLASRVRGPERRAKDLEAHLTGQKHVYERENLKGAATMAQNSGRLTAFEALAAASNPEVQTATAEYEASEILDDRTCGPCEAVDGTTYESLDEAEADYATGGYVDCEGGPNCRGTLVAIYPEQNPVGGEGALREAEPAYLGGGGGEAAPEDVAVEPEPSDLGGAGGEAITDPAVMLDAITNAPDLAAAVDAFNPEIATHEHVTALGHHALRATEARVAEHNAPFTTLEPRYKQLNNDYMQAGEVWRKSDERFAPGEGPSLFDVKDKWAEDPAHPEVGPLARKMFELEAEMDRLTAEMKALDRTSFDKVLPQVLAEVREMGGSLDLAPAKAASQRQAETLVRLPKAATKPGTAATTKALDLATSRVPKAWLDASNEAGKLEPVVISGRAFELNLNGEQLPGRTMLEDGRIAASKAKWQDPEGRTILHELTHRMQAVVPHLSRLEGEFWTRRAAADPRGVQSLRQLTGKPYKSGERAVGDEFLNAYTGKVYNVPAYGHDTETGSPFLQAGTEAERPMEVATTGIEGLYFNVDAMRVAEGGDRDLAAFVAGLLAGV